MKNVVTVKENQSSRGEWLVCTPELPSYACWSSHDSKEEAIAEAESLVEDMGYDSVIVQ